MPKVNMIHLFPTFSCNFYCTHCYVNSLKYKKNKSRFYDDVKLKEILKFLNRENPTVVHVEGGEPLLFKNIFKLISGIKNKDSLVIVTNASLINPKIVKKLEKAGLKKIVVSLEGSNSNTNKIIRGNHFSKTIRGIKFLLESNIRIELSSTLHKSNISDMENIIEKGKELGVVQIRFGILLAAGRGQKTHNIQLNDDDIKKIINKFILLEKKYYNEIKLTLSLPGYFKKMLPKGINHIFYKCDAGINQFAIGPNGEVYSCYNLVDSFLDKSVNISDLLENKDMIFDKGICPIRNSGHIYLGFK